jgi:hypothetical protein
MALAAVGGWLFSNVNANAVRRKEQEQELGRLRFKTENQEATRLAIREELTDLRAELAPTLAEIRADINEMHTELVSVRDKAEEALRRGLLLEKGQRDCQAFLQKTLFEDKDHASQTRPRNSN